MRDEVSVASDPMRLHDDGGCWRVDDGFHYIMGDFVDRLFIEIGFFIAVLFLGGVCDFGIVISGDGPENIVVITGFI